MEPADEAEAGSAALPKEGAPPGAEGTSPQEAPEPPPSEDRGRGALLIAAIFLAAGSGLVYELVAGTLSSYLIGDSVTQFSLVIGLFLTSMGIGSFFSGKITRDLPAWFVAVEVGAGLAGGLTALLAYAAFALTPWYTPVLLLLVVTVGTLVGFEIPLVVRILREVESLREALAHVLTADYLGALVASLVFPFLLLPYLGLVRAGLMMGLVNVLVGAFTLHLFRGRLGPHRRRLQWLCATATALLVACLLGAGQLVSLLEARLYQDEIVIAETTTMQRMVITRWRNDIRLFLEGHLQFSSIDEYRYHETLIHPALAAAERQERVLLLGGGDGLAAREALRDPGVKHITLVDIDPRVTDLFSTREMLTELNQGALTDPRVRVVNMDAFKFLEETDEFWDVIAMDLPDPSTPALAKLYSLPFFRLAGRRLAQGGALVTQSTSPFRSREAFWAIHHTLEAAEVHGGPGRFQVHAMQTVVPTFGTWGFQLATARPIDPAKLKLRVSTRYLTSEFLPTIFEFPDDMGEVETPIGHLDDPAVHTLYVRGYNRYLE